MIIPPHYQHFVRLWREKLAAFPALPRAMRVEVCVDSCLYRVATPPTAPITDAALDIWKPYS